MNELLKIKYDNDRITLSARELHTFLESEERFSKCFDRFSGYGFVEGIDYTPYQKVHPQNLQSIQDYQLTIDMAKEIAMLQRSDKGKEIRQYFIQIEKEWNTPERVMARGLEASRLVIEKQNKMLLEQKHKVDFYDSVADSKSAIPMDQVAKVIAVPGVGRNKLFEFLREAKILQYNNIPYQKYVDAGYFRVVETKFTKPDGSTNINIKTLVYQKGVDYIRKKLEECR
ncbi:MAG: phage antirepressor KilAC domain-containing protein [Erysipelotrichaceae bacterium]|nr:phage antirepressor KilAC domain-containing protein [Erysipelotrichaceae bacterium]